MSQHKPDFLYTNRSGTTEHRVRCFECGETSGWLPVKQECEDWWRKHIERIERIKTHLGTKTPSLKAQQAYYQKMADDTANSAEHREMWQQLADGLAHRLNASGGSADQFLPGFDGAVP